MMDIENNFTPPNTAESADRSKQTSKTSADSFLRSIPEELIKREDSICCEMNNLNASVQTKLGKLFELTNEFSALAAPYVACKKGCSSCCKMNVMITLLEAARIRKETGHIPKTLRSSMHHPIGKFLGVPCPFLRDEACSIYESRPLACRIHFSFDASSHWCHPERSTQVDLQMVRFDGILEAYCSLTRINTRGVIADIRDFFPSNL